MNCHDCGASVTLAADFFLYSATGNRCPGTSVPTTNQPSVTVGGNPVHSPVPLSPQD